VATLAVWNCWAMALIFFEFPHDLEGLLDSLGVGLPLKLITLRAPRGHISPEAKHNRQ